MIENMTEKTPENMNKNWYLLYCKSREEDRAQANLANQGVESFFPTIQKEKILHKKKVIVDEALFPSYLFILIDPEDAVFPRIRSTRGVFDFVRSAGKVVIAPSALLDEMKALSVKLHQADTTPEKLFKEGDYVEIQSGSFKGIKAIYTCNDGAERSMLLLNVLNKEQKLSFENTDLKKIEK